jgi:hypothetical protein
MIRQGAFQSFPDLSRSFPTGRLERVVQSFPGFPEIGPLESWKAHKHWVSRTWAELSRAFQPVLALESWKARKKVNEIKLSSFPELSTPYRGVTGELESSPPYPLGATA